MASTINANVSVPTLCIHTPIDSTSKLNYTYRNRIINGDFSVWQRGTSFSISPSGYTADRWLATIAGSVTRQSFLPGESELLDNDAYYIRLAPSAYGSIVLEQRIEDVRTLAGKQVTLTFWAKSVGGTSLTASALQYFGSGGSSSVLTSLGTATILGAWSKHTITATLPTIASMTIGAGSDHYLALKLTISAVTLDVAHVQLEHGPLATDFEKRLPGEELRLARRYYEQIEYAIGSRACAIGHATATTSAILMLKYSTKRAAPTVTVPSDIQVLDAAMAPIVTAWSTAYGSVESTEIVATVAAGLVAGDAVMAQAAAAAHIDISAEL